MARGADDRRRAEGFSGRRLTAVAAITWGFALPLQAVELELARFQVDATPPLGAPLCDGLVKPALGVDDPLSARGVVLLPSGQLPVVLAAVDWVGIGNEGYDRWREALAEAAETTVERVAVHALHPHDAPGCDFSAERLAAEAGLAGELFPVDYALQAIERTATALRQSLKAPSRTTHIAWGKAKVEQIASNRRLLGPDGKVQHIRFSSCTDPAVRALPEGIIDPYVRCISFWHDDAPLVLLTYYATHPQSYYGAGRISADFVGLARTMREKSLPDAAHIHFNGAGGNVAAGKYNDGRPENRPALASRLALGMEKAWEESRDNKTPLGQLEFAWDVQPVELPLSRSLDKQERRLYLANAEAPKAERLRAARDLTWIERCEAGHRIDVARLRLGPLQTLHMPGELFVEYQLAAQAMRPSDFVCMAAYGDYGPGYIGVASAYDQGGYETGRVSRVAPQAEQALTKAIDALLSDETEARK